MVEGPGAHIVPGQSISLFPVTLPPGKAIILSLKALKPGTDLLSRWATVFQESVSILEMI